MLSSPQIDFHTLMGDPNSVNAIAIFWERKVG